jgi:DnaK suppressor protein
MSRKEFLRRQRQVLLTLRRNVQRGVAAARGELGPGPDRRADAFDADGADHVTQTHLAASSVTAGSDELARINHALDRHRAGEYGLCETCGTSIPMSRLSASPAATRCITCQIALEFAPRGEGIGTKCGER